MNGTAACADTGDLNDARHHVGAAERSVALRKGTAWQAAIAKAQAHLHRAEGASEAGPSVQLSASTLLEAVAGRGTSDVRASHGQLPNSAGTCADPSTGE